jgi:phasin protein
LSSELGQYRLRSVGLAHGADDLDARGRSPMYRQSSRPSLGGEAGGRSLGFIFNSTLSYAKDVQDMLRIQMEFMRSQLEAFGEQAKDLSEAYIKAASGQTTKPPQSR